MNRVWKRFFLKVGKTVAVVSGLVAYVLALAFLFSFIGINPRVIGAAIMLVGFGVPMTIFFLYTTYKDAEYEVKRENKDLLDKIKG